MAAVEDVLATRLDLLGLGGYVGGFDQATAAVGLHESALTSAQGRALSFGVAAGAVGLGGLNFFRKAALAAGEDVATFGRASANLKGQLSPGELADFTGELERATGVADDSIAGFVGLLGTFQATAAAARTLSPVESAKRPLPPALATAAAPALPFAAAIVFAAAAASSCARARRTVWAIAMTV